MNKLVTVIFFLGITTLSYSQSWKELNNQFLELFKRNQFLSALPIALAAKDSAQNQFGTKNRNYATSLNNLAAVYSELGQYKKAEDFLVKSIQLRKEIFGDGHRIYASGLNNMASLYEKMGHFEKAEPLYLQAIEIDKKVLGENHPDYISDISNLAGLYWQVGQYEKAELLYLRVVEKDKKVLGENHRDYASDLCNLGLLYGKMGHYQKAESLFTQALQIEKKILGTNQPTDVTTLNNLAALYHTKGELTKAEPLYIEAVAISKRVFGENHPDFATTVNNLALVYKDEGRYNLAEPLYQQSKEIRKKIFGENHKVYAASLNNLANLYESIHQFTKAEQLLIQSSRIEIENMQRSFSVLSEKEKVNYLKRVTSLLPTNNSFLYRNNKASSALIVSNFNQQLIFKSFILSDIRNLFETAAQTKDTAIKNLLEHWQNNKILLAKEYSLPLLKRTTTLFGIEQTTEALEKELNRKLSSFRIQQQKVQVTAASIRDNLKNNEVAIEFVSFRLFNNEWTDSTIYAAYILPKSDSIPIFVPLCEEKQLQKLFDSAGTTASAMVSQFYRGLELKKKNTAGTLGAELYKLIWQPLEPYLKNVKKISYSPAGKLYSIAFHALPVDSTTVLMDKFQLQQYTSTRQVVLREQEKQNSKPQYITLFGDASFTLDSLQLVKQKIYNPDKNTISTSIYTPKKRNDENNTWISLPGTAQEVKTIQQVFEQNKITTKSFTQITASEENLKALSGNSSQILHIATHGFFLPEPDKKRNDNHFNSENTYTLADDPLLRSGLILAGGNYAWSGKPPIDGVEDGIATAYEISQLNLSNTELVVLSACETALGDVKGSEGVFGLQRAFKMAGVKKMIVSLWQVPDKETAELMTAFYSYWMKGKTINDAFAQAQADMRKKYAPFYWAAFVLVE